MPKILLVHFFSGHGVYYIKLISIVIKNLCFVCIAWDNATGCRQSDESDFHILLTSLIIDGCFECCSMILS